MSKLQYLKLIPSLLCIASMAISYTSTVVITDNQAQSISIQSPNIQGHNKPQFIIVIDPGHGGKDQGCSQHDHKEKEITLPLALALGNHLTRMSPSIQVYYTRSQDVAIPPSQRIKLANNLKADLFISIHANAIHDATINGFETYIYGKADETFQALNISHDQLASTDNLKLADKIMTSILKSNCRDRSFRAAMDINAALENSGIENRGLRQAEFKVLRKATVPAILLEVGYLTNPAERKNLQDNHYQSFLTENIASGIVNYLRS